MSAPALPPAVDPPPVRLPEVVERRLPSGLVTWAVREPEAPLVELRMWVPLAAAPRPLAALLTETLLLASARTDRRGTAGRLRDVGAYLAATVDADRLLISGGCLADGLPELLAVLAELLCRPGYRPDDVDRERARLAEQLRLVKAQPDTVVFEALGRRLHGDHHPYGAAVPEPSEVATVTGDMLHQAHRQWLGPDRAHLVLVGDLDPQPTVAAVAATLGAWRAEQPSPPPPPVPPVHPGPVTLLHHPQAPSGMVRVAARVVGRTHPDHSALTLANLVLGGYFSSRLVANLRQARGYAYTASSTVIHARAGSAVMIAADVAPERTAAAWWEIQAELGRLVADPVAGEELERARRYARGAVPLRLASQRRLADLLVELAGAGLRPDWLREHADRLATVTAEDVQQVAGRYLAPAAVVSVLLGDRPTVRTRLEPLTAVTG